MQLQSRLVDVPCRTITTTATALIASVRGKQAIIPLRYIAHQAKDYITVPEWYAYEQHFITADKCLSVADLANRFGSSNAWVYSNLRKLEAEGFPKPVLSWGKKRWDPAAVSNWFAQRARQNPAHQAFTPASMKPVPLEEPQPITDTGATRARLAAAYGA